MRLNDKMNEPDKSTKVDFTPKMLSPQEQLEKHQAELIEQMSKDNAPEAGAYDSVKSKPDDATLEERVIAALKTIYDPEIPVNIYDLGLIYRVQVKDQYVEVDMTLTAPGCPVAQTFPGMVEGTVRLVPGVEDAFVELVWDPPWRQEYISEEARLELGLL